MTIPASNRRVWLITGATSGSGRSLTEEVLRQGDIVVGAGRSIGRLDDLSDAYPDQLFPVMLDVTDTARDAEVVDEMVQRFGGLDVLVNGAGRTQVGALEETTDAEMRFLFELHYFGPVALTKAALPHMRRQGGGRVVQFSSVGFQRRWPGHRARVQCLLRD
jgi:NAD(P)-dependent dehydrogenase (short-subunit alcohol dehydrogenase family)